MADPRTLGELLRAARERAGLSIAQVALAAARAYGRTLAPAEAADCLHSDTRYFARAWMAIEAGGPFAYNDGTPRAELHELAAGLDLPGVPDAWYAAAGLVPPDVAALAADPARWAAIRHIAARESALRENDAALEAATPRQLGIAPLGAFCAHIACPEEVPCPVHDGRADGHAATARVVAAARALVAPATAGGPDPLAPLNEDGARRCVACDASGLPFRDDVVHAPDCAADALRAALAALDARDGATPADADTCPECATPRGRHRFACTRSPWPAPPSGDGAR